MCAFDKPGTNGKLGQRDDSIDAVDFTHFPPDVMVESSGKASDAILTMDGTGTILSASESVEHVFGWTSVELYGQNVKVLVPEPKRTSLDRYLDRYRPGGGPSTKPRTGRFEAVRKNGSRFEIELSMSRADIPARNTPYFIGIVRDVSRQVVHESDPDAENVRLHRLIAEQTRALATANLRAHLADRLASLGTLAAGLGHDMNNVLLPVRARLTAIEHSGISEKGSRHVQAVRRSISYLQHLSDGLHFLAVDPDAKAVSHDGEGVTDLAIWWSQVGPLLERALPPGVKIASSIPWKLPSVRTAPHWLTQAMLNLIINAGESIPSERRNGLVRIRAAQSEDGSCVRLSVTDNGRGMSLEIQRRAFDLFFTTKSRGMGTGLGLPLVRKVVLRAGGDLEVRSELGKGTTITLVLPVGQGAACNARGSVWGGGTSAPVTTRTAAISVRDHRASALIAQIVVSAGIPARPVKGDAPGDARLWITDPTRAAMKAAAAWRIAERGQCENGACVVAPAGVEVGSGDGAREGASGGKSGGAGKAAVRCAVVLLGPPAKALSKGWEKLGALVIEPIDSFEAMREVIGQAIELTEGESVPPE